MPRQPILRNFVSEIDLFLQQFAKEHPLLSKSQQREVNKYQRIYRLRDRSVSAASPGTPVTSLWKGF